MQYIRHNGGHYLGNYVGLVQALYDHCRGKYLEHYVGQYLYGGKYLRYPDSV